MIIDFSVKNFRSIKDLQTISFIATKLDSNQEKFPDTDLNNIVEKENFRLLKTVGIYGANASGKSNIIRALEYFYNAISDLPSPVSRLSNLADPYLFQENFNETDSFFQITILLEGKKYRYGFTVRKSNYKIKNQIESNSQQAESNEIITNEWLYGPKETNQVKYFIRKDLKLENDNLSTEKLIPELEYKHSLYLTHVASYDREGICSKIRNYLGGYMISNYRNGIESFRFHTINLIEGLDSGKEKLLQFLSEFQLNYSDISLIKDDELHKKRVVPQNKISLTKKINSINNEYATLNLMYTESEGTKKIFDISGLLIHAFNLKTSGLIVIDELDSNFHPSLVIQLIKLFNNPLINKAGVQILFTSHDTNLLNPSLLRRDQVYFTEKDNQDATRLYSLADLKGIRNDADFARQYLAGFYGGLPILGTFHNDLID